MDNFKYVAPAIAAEKLAKSLEELGYGKDATILDLRCGTGKVGKELFKHGYRAIDGLDYTSELLEIAKTKGVYGKLFSIVHVKGKGFDDLMF